jgi:hypothetical protein
MVRVKAMSVIKWESLMRIMVYEELWLENSLAGQD